MVFVFLESMMQMQQEKPKQTKVSEINATLPKAITVYLIHFKPLLPMNMDGMPGQKSRIDPSGQVLGDIMAYCKKKDTDKDGKVNLSPKEQAELRLLVIDKLNERNNGKVPKDFFVSDGVEKFTFKNWGQYYDKVVSTFLKTEATIKLE